MKIEVLGPGCARCDQLYDNVLTAVSDMDSPIEVVKISDIHYFAEKGVFITPGLVIDGRVVSTGKVLTPEEIREEISNAAG